MGEARRIGKKEVQETRAGPPKVHVFVATPAYNGRVDDCYSQSLAEAAFTCPLFGVGFTACTLRGGAFIDMTRNMYVHWFLTKPELQECTHLFFIDSDLRFEARSMIGLARSGKPLAVGVYRRREERETYPIVTTDAPGGGLMVETDQIGEWILADRAATGFMCIERKVLVEMAAEARKVELQEVQGGKVAWLFHTYINEKGQFVGEDFAFCDDYRKKYGKSIHVWPDMDFTHGGFKGNFKAWLMKQIDGPPKETQNGGYEVPKNPDIWTLTTEQSQSAA